MDPVKILPVEMWSDILGRLTTQKDLQNAYNTCSLWRSLVGSEWMFSGVFPSLFKYLPKSDILKTRLVCKSWKKTIDTYLENDQPSVAAPGSHYLFTGRTSLRVVEVNFGIDQLEVLQNFQNHFTTAADAKGSIKNPFVSRSLHLTVTEMNQEILTFFEKFGAHVWSLRLSIPQLGPPQIGNAVQLARFIWSILWSTPNLKKLDLYTMQNVKDFPGLEEPERNAQMLQLEQFLDRNPTPHLPQLSNLHLDVHFHLIREILETAYAPQLTKYVHVASHEFLPDNNLTNLKEAAWHFVHGCKLNLVNKLKNLKSPCLQRLHIYIRPSNNSEINFLCEAVEKFKSSLVYLSIFWKVFEPTLSQQLDLPLVQELNLEIVRFKKLYSINFHFLRKLKSLRKLKCVFWKKKPLQLFMLQQNQNYEFLEDYVDLHYHLDDENVQGGPYQSNIWDLVPTLDVIEIQIVGKVRHNDVPAIIQSKVYTRAQKDRVRAAI